MFCPQCGTQVPDQARFCPKCGHAVLQYTPENQGKDFSRVQREPSISALAQFKIGLGFIIAAVLVASGVCLGMEDVLAALLYSVGILAVGAGIGVVLIVISLKGVAKDSQDQIQEYKAYTEKWGGLLKVIPAIFVAALIIRCISSFSGMDPNTSLADFGVESMTANIALSDTFDQTDLAITPVAVSYVSNGIFYDTYGDLHASIALDITCLGSSWAPTYEDVTFWVDGSASFKSEFDHTEIKRGETFRYTFTHPLITSTVQDVDMRLKLKCKTGATIELYFTIDDIQDSPIFSGEGLYNDFVETNEASFPVPEVGRNIDPTEFDGVYANVDNQKELLIIDWYDFVLTLSCYNNETTFFNLVNVDPYDWSAEIPFSGNKIVAAPDTLLPSMYESNYNYNITYTYVPSDLSPYRVDTIYMESADFKNAVFIREEEANIYSDNNHWNTTNGDAVAAESEYNKFIGSYSGDDALFDAITIEREGTNLEIVCSGYRETYFAATVPMEDGFGGSYLRFVGENPYTNIAYEIELAYVPADTSPHKVDTVYMLSDDLFQMAYKRTED